MHRANPLDDMVDGTDDVMKRTLTRRLQEELAEQRRNANADPARNAASLVARIPARL